jgi:hypothetical protein
MIAFEISGSRVFCIAAVCGSAGRCAAKQWANSTLPGQSATSVRSLNKGGPAMSTPPQGHQRVRSSSRPSPVPYRNTPPQVIEGHGEWIQTTFGSYPTFRVPDSIEIVIYQGTGVGLDDRDGRLIALMQSLPGRLSTEWDRGNAEYDTEPSRRGSVRANTPGRRIYYGGDECPDLTLYNPREQGFAAFNAQPSSITIDLGLHITLRAIAEQVPAGTQLRWAACTVLR